MENIDTPKPPNKKDPYGLLAKLDSVDKADKKDPYGLLAKLDSVDGVKKKDPASSPASETTPAHSGGGIPGAQDLATQGNNAIGVTDPTLKSSIQAQQMPATLPGFRPIKPSKPTRTDVKPHNLTVEGQHKNNSWGNLGTFIPHTVIKGLEDDVSDLAKFVNLHTSNATDKMALMGLASKLDGASKGHADKLQDNQLPKTDAGEAVSGFAQFVPTMIESALLPETKIEALAKLGKLGKLGMFATGKMPVVMGGKGLVHNFVKAKEEGKDDMQAWGDGLIGAGKEWTQGTLMEMGDALGAKGIKGVGKAMEKAGWVVDNKLAKGVGRAIMHSMAQATVFGTMPIVSNAMDGKGTSMHEFWKNGIVGGMFGLVHGAFHGEAEGKAENKVTPADGAAKEILERSPVLHLANFFAADEDAIAFAHHSEHSPEDFQMMAATHAQQAFSEGDPEKKEQHVVASSLFSKLAGAKAMTNALLADKEGFMDALRDMHLDKDAHQQIVEKAERVYRALDPTEQKISQLDRHIQDSDERLRNLQQPVEGETPSDQKRREMEAAEEQKLNDDLNKQQQALFDEQRKDFDKKAKARQKQLPEAAGGQPDTKQSTPNSAGEKPAGDAETQIKGEKPAGEKSEKQAEKKPDEPKKEPTSVREFNEAIDQLDKDYFDRKLDIDHKEYDRRRHDLEVARTQFKLANPDIELHHGSPHDFEKFKNDKIGSGEGNQAFGWGLYFTTDDKIARYYAEKLSKDKDGKIYSVKIKDGYNKKWATWRDPMDDDAYDVVIDKLKKMGYDMQEFYYLGGIDHGYYDFYPAFGNVYKELAEMVGQDKASELFKDAGYAGIEYKAKKGRSEQSNYVVFDPKFIEITKKSGLSEDASAEPAKPSKQELSKEFEKQTGKTIREGKRILDAHERSERQKAQKKGKSTYKPKNSEFSADQERMIREYHGEDISDDLKKRIDREKKAANKPKPPREPLSESRQRAVDYVMHNLIHNDTFGEGINLMAPRFDLRMPTADLDKAVRDIKKGNYDTAPAKELLNTLEGWEEADNYPFVQGNGGSTENIAAIGAKEMREQLEDAKANALGELSDRQVEEFNKSIADLGITAEDIKAAKEYEQSRWDNEGASGGVQEGVPEAGHDGAAGKADRSDDKTAQVRDVGPEGEPGKPEGEVKDTRPTVYHGSADDFDEFDDSKRGAFTKASSAKEGFFFTSSKAVADTYRHAGVVDRPNIKELRAHLESMPEDQLKSLYKHLFGKYEGFYFDDDDPQASIDEIIDAAKEDKENHIFDKTHVTEKIAGHSSNEGGKYRPYETEGKVHEVKLNMKNPMVVDMDGEEAADAEISKLIKQAKDAGHDGLIIKNLHDEAAINEKGSTEAPSDIHIVFDKSQIELSGKTPKPKAEAVPDEKPEFTDVEAGMPEVVRKFWESDVAPALAAIAHGTKTAMDFIVKLFHPVHGVSLEAMDHIAGSLNRQNEVFAQVDKAVRHIEKMFDKLPVAERIKFVDNMKMGKPQATPELDQIAKMLRPMEDNVFKELEKRRPGIQYKENHVRVLWKVVPGSKNLWEKHFNSKRPLAGSRGMFKKSTLSNMSEGIAKGGVPVSYNPITMFKMAHADAMKFITAHDMLEGMKKSKLMRFVRKGEDVPEGFAQVKDHITDVYMPTPNGLVHAGKWYMEENAARIVNNRLSRDYIRENKVGMGALAVKNFTTAMELTLSPFHFVAESMEAISSQLGVGFRKMVNLRDFSGAGDVLTAMAAPVKAYKAGRQLISLASQHDFEQSEIGKKLLERMPEMHQYLHDFFTGGGLTFQNTDYKLQDNAMQAFKDNMATGNYIGAAWRALPAFNQLIMHPLFDVFIPALKVGVFMKEFPTLLRENEKSLASGKITRDALARKTVNFIDDRLGEMAFDNLFWNRTFKSAMQLNFRSITWKLGNVRAMMGAPVEQGMEFMNAFKEGRSPNMTPKMAWLFGLAAMQATFATAIQYMFTGTVPSSIKDLITPRISKDDPNDRVILPTYAKDPSIIAKEMSERHGWHKGSAITDYVASSLSGTAGNAIALWQNKDFQNYQIYDPNQGFAENTADAVKFSIPQPISVSNIKRDIKNDEPWQKTAFSFMGFGKAPAELRNSSIENKIFDSYNMYKAVKSKGQKEANELREDAISLFKRGKYDDAEKIIVDGIQKGLLKVDDIPRMTRKSLGLDDPSQSLFKQLPDDVKLELFKEMTEAEQLHYSPDGKVQRMLLRQQIYEQEHSKKPYSSFK